MRIQLPAPCEVPGTSLLPSSCFPADRLRSLFSWRAQGLLCRPFPVAWELLREWPVQWRTQLCFPGFCPLELWNSLFKKSFVDFPIPSPAIFSAPLIAELFQGVIQTCNDPLPYSISSVPITVSFPPHCQDRPMACIRLNGHFPLTHLLSGHSWQMSCLLETALDSLSS